MNLDEKLCPSCEKIIEKAAAKCSFCGTELPVANESASNSNKKGLISSGSNMPSVWSFLLILAIGGSMAALLLKNQSGLFSRLSNTSITSANTDIKSLTGQWDLAATSPEANEPPIVGVMKLKQDGSTIEGYGVDKLQFQLSGTVDGDKIHFLKQSIKDGVAIGKPVEFTGKVDFRTEQLPSNLKYFVHISGIWQVTKRVGEGWKAQIVQLHGKWEAGLKKR